MLLCHHVDSNLHHIHVRMENVCLFHFMYERKLIFQTILQELFYSLNSFIYFNVQHSHRSAGIYSVFYFSG